ncbi:MAG: hypothetical protein V9E81_04680 [Marmoricola sp.]
MNQSGRTLDIGPLVKKADSGWTEFPPAAQKTAEFGDKVIGFPAVVDNLGVLYNKDLFDQAELGLPEPGLDLGRLPSRRQGHQQP